MTKLTSETQAKLFSVHIDEANDRQNFAKEWDQDDSFYNKWLLIGALMLAFATWALF